MNYLLVIVGPTAVGKTAFCLDIAKAFDTEIVSADSRQFFQELEIGTAKPTPAELAQVKHHFINSHSINDLVSAGLYEKQALECLDKLFQKHRHVVLTGGSGLYIQAVVEGMSDIPALDSKIRQGLNDRLTDEGLEQLLSELEECDPEYYQKVDRANPQRVLRALEVFKGTGRKYSEYRDSKSAQRPFKTIKIGLERDREELYQRIDQRMDLMIDEGLFEEAEEMMQYRSHNALQTVGYKEIFDYLDGAYDKNEAIRLLKRNSRRYAKRQMTWFRRDDKVKWYSPDEPSKVIDYVKSLTKEDNI